jgi:hypothetical protein
MASEGKHGGLSAHIDHHLHHLANKHPTDLFDLSVDTLFFSLVCAAIILTGRRLVFQAGSKPRPRYSSGWSARRPERPSTATRATSRR